MIPSGPERTPSLAAHVRLKIDPLTGEPLLLYPEGMLLLNRTAHEIVRRCDGRTRIADLLGQLAREFEADEAVLRRDLLQTLDDLERRNLLRFSP